MRDLFAILFRPQVTLDRLLFDRDTRRSWQATWLIIGVQSLFVLAVLLAFLTAYSTRPELVEQFNVEMAGQLPIPLTAIVILLWVIATAGIVVYYTLARFLFAWITRWGLRMVAGEQYPQTGEERREKGKLLELIHPYSISVRVWPDLLLNSIVVILALYLIVTLDSENPVIALSYVAVSTLSSAVTLGTLIYMLMIRVFAVKKIYGVSGPRAFWGPFLAYVLVWIIGMVVAVLLVGALAAAVDAP